MTEDISKNFIYSRPSFNNRDEEVKHLYKRYEGMMTTEAIPPLPNREQELNYLKWLEKSFSEDPFVTLHPKLYQAGPFRLYYRYWKEMLGEYKKTFLKNFVLTVGLTWPLIIYLAQRKRYHKHTGVPVTYLRTNLFTPDYRLPDSFYNETSRRKFKWGVFKYSVIIGLIGAYLTTDNEYLKNDINTRPDFNSMRIMTPLPIKEKKVFEMMQGDYFGMKFNETPESKWKKFLHYWYPYYDYHPDASYYEPFFDYKKDYVTEEHKNHYHFDI